MNELISVTKLKTLSVVSVIAVSPDKTKTSDPKSTLTSLLVVLVVLPPPPPVVANVIVNVFSVEITELISLKHSAL